jgi:hypothetical protein
LACYTAVAEFVDGNLKRDIINLLTQSDKAKECVVLLQKLGGAEEGDAVRVCREMLEDLDSGMTDDEVAERIHRYQFQAYYYTQKEHVPTDDPHWRLIELKNVNEFVEQTEKGTIKSKIVFEDDI